MLAAGCGLVGAMAVFTDKVYSVEQAQQLLDMDVFGALPFVKKKQEQKSILITRSKDFFAVCGSCGQDRHKASQKDARKSL